jgi:hypothetical protein
MLATSHVAVMMCARRYTPNVVRVGVNVHHSVAAVSLDTIVSARLGDGVRTAGFIVGFNAACLDRCLIECLPACLLATSAAHPWLHQLMARLNAPPLTTYTMCCCCVQEGGKKGGPAARASRDRMRAAILDEASVVCSTLSFAGSNVFTRLSRK